MLIKPGAGMEYFHVSVERGVEPGDWIATAHTPRITPGRHHHGVKTWESVVPAPRGEEPQ